MQCQIMKFGKCVNRFARKLFDECFGNLPFEYGRLADYWPEHDYDTELMFDIKQRMYASTRDE